MSHRIINIQGIVRRDLYFKTLNVGPVGVSNSRPPAFQPGAQPNEPPVRGFRLEENVCCIKRIYNSTIKEDMFHMFTYGCETVFCTCFGSIDCSIFFPSWGGGGTAKKTSFNHILFFICDVGVEFEEKNCRYVCLQWSILSAAYFCPACVKRIGSHGS